MSIQTGKTLTILSRNITKRRFIVDGLGSSTDWDNLKKYRCKLGFMDDAQEGFTVSARQLHKALGSKRQFTNWIEYRFSQLKAVEGVDYLINKFVKQARGGGVGGKGIRNTVLDDYLLTPETAKNIAMMEGTEAGLIVRSYFVWCERVARKYAAYNAIRSDGFTKLDKELKHELAKRKALHKTEQVHRELCEILTGKTPHEWKEATGLAPRDAMSLEEQQRYQKGYGLAVDLFKLGQKWGSIKQCVQHVHGLKSF